ncbi:hypothetical protein [Pseudoalteromonas obscura]|uniref:Uncharacterized protein n=1 Tax=Pseudoalteromonas obscura TaxID=3048491 RepID=A0ABT7EUB3_9GAMM|nr:hypothetical protein [Pseudoalteromonas sp. P94(2023)]MDK2598642.1 hypothetical protein [Pseudoalteromonas sp. P94(2023)]
MELDTLFLVLMIGFVVRLAALVMSLKNSDRQEEMERDDPIVSLVEKPQNVESIARKSKENDLLEAARLLVKSDALEKMFEHACELDLQQYDLEFRFEKRQFLKGLQRKGIIDINKEKEVYIKRVSERR